jgi:hypothetical protein
LAPAPGLVRALQGPDVIRPANSVLNEASFPASLPFPGAAVLPPEPPVSRAFRFAAQHGLNLLRAQIPLDASRFAALRAFLREPSFPHALRFLHASRRAGLHELFLHSAQSFPYEGSSRAASRARSARRWFRASQSLHLEPALCGSCCALCLRCRLNATRLFLAAPSGLPLQEPSALWLAFQLQLPPLFRWSAHATRSRSSDVRRSPWHTSSCPRVPATPAVAGLALAAYAAHSSPCARPESGRAECRPALRCTTHGLNLRSCFDAQSCC